jgi:flagellar basal body P-ring formation protein FlgA
MRYSVSIFFFLVALFGTAASGDADMVTLQDKASVSGEYIKLGDVASIKGPHARELGELPLMKSPRNASGVTLSSQFVGAKIKEKLPGVLASLTGAPHVSVCARQARISGTELEALYRDAVSRSNPYKERGSIEISDVKAPSSIFVPEKDKALLQANFSQGEDFLGLVTATISVRDSSVDICRVSGKIRMLAQVPVAGRLIRRGEVITEGDLELKTWDISASPLLVSDMKECLGMRAKTTLQAGKPLLRSNIAQPPLVSRGDIVALEARSEELVIMDRGIALKDGFLGEKIPIKNAGSGKQVVGTIIARSLVEVTF